MSENASGKHSLQSLLTSSIGQKAIVAVTGVGLIIFVVAHMLGNLQFFIGPDALNGYAKFLKSNPAILWPARIGLLVFFLSHVYFAVSLKRRSVAARPVPYAFQNTVQASAASRTMLITGTVILIYVCYHLAHFTLGLTHPEHHQMLDSAGRHDVYGMVVRGFKILPVSLFYIAAMAVLAVHLSHGISSFFQTLGLASAKHSPILRKFAAGLSTVIFLGYIAIPLYVLVMM